VIINSSREIINSRRMLMVLPDEIVSKRDVIINSCRDMISSRRVLVVLPDEFVRKPGVTINSSRHDQLPARPYSFAGRNCQETGRDHQFVPRGDRLEVRAEILRDEIVRERGGIISSCREMIIRAQESQSPPAKNIVHQKCL